MNITLESTTKIVELNGIKARVWEGETASGIKVHAFIPRLGELQECRAPSAEIAAYPLKLIL